MSEDKVGMGFKIDRELLRQMIKAKGGIRSFSRNAGLNRQTLYNIFGGMYPDYITICRISKALDLTGNQVATVFFVNAEPEK